MMGEGSYAGVARGGGHGAREGGGEAAVMAWFRRAGIGGVGTQGSTDRPCFAAADRFHPGLLSCTRPFRARVVGAEVG